MLSARQQCVKANPRPQTTANTVRGTVVWVTFFVCGGWILQCDECCDELCVGGCPGQWGVQKMGPQKDQDTLRIWWIWCLHCSWTAVGGSLGREGVCREVGGWLDSVNHRKVFRARDGVLQVGPEVLLQLAEPCRQGLCKLSKALWGLDLCVPPVGQ